MAGYPRPPLPKFNLNGAPLKEHCEGKLLPHQTEALAELESWFAPEKQGQIAVVSMPTGSGKTGIMCCLPYFLGSIGLQVAVQPSNQPTGIPLYPFDKPILVIAPDLQIANQLEQQMLVSRTDHREQTFLIKREIVPLDRQAHVLPTGVKIEETSDLKNKPYIEGKEIIIANAQKFLRDDWKEALPDDMFQLVIVDEAHHHPAKTWENIVDKFKGHALVVFFTATPYRGDKKSILDPLPIAYHLPLERAITDGTIRRTEFIELPRDMIHKFQGIKIHAEQVSQQDGATERFAMILNEVRAVQTRKDEEVPLPGGVPHMAMAIAKNTRNANLLVQVWKYLWPDAPAFAYHSDMNVSQRKDVMGKLQNNQLKLVVVVAMLLEGFDHPPISIAAITHRIASPVKFVQFVGRAQRICRRGPECREVDGIAHIITHSHYEQRQNYDKFVNESLIPGD